MTRSRTRGDEVYKPVAAAGLCMLLGVVQLDRTVLGDIDVITRAEAGDVAGESTDRRVPRPGIISDPVTGLQTGIEADKYGFFADVDDGKRGHGRVDVPVGHHRFHDNAVACHIGILDQRMVLIVGNIHRHRGADAGSFRGRHRAAVGCCLGIEIGLADD